MAEKVTGEPELVPGSGTCSGARVLATLIYALRQRGLERGLATLCLGGEAVAMAIEMET